MKLLFRSGAFGVTLSSVSPSIGFAFTANGAWYLADGPNSPYVSGCDTAGNGDGGIKAGPGFTGEIGVELYRQSDNGFGNPQPSKRFSMLFVWLRVLI